MNFVTTSPSPAKIGPNLFDVLKELLLIKPVFLLGIILVYGNNITVVSQKQVKMHENSCFFRTHVLLFMLHVCKYCRHSLTS